MMMISLLLVRFGDYRLLDQNGHIHWMNFWWSSVSVMVNTRETTHAIRKLPLIKAKRYLEDVLAHKQAIPFTRFCRGVGQTKNRHSNGQGRWPAKSAKFILDLLKNAEETEENSGENS
ncbi:60S ribosomal protein l17-1 [Heracleum sosnowskyi]|uniref:60S ribosomal protein l17-1 n=1 Tax=Heracleum sosnowskyi TaxID=360622 RepID=A0AAD8IY21_9APIA|nr:60S ribosomal protein l17-1 [Heracleum sosnowskyi]